VETGQVRCELVNGLCLYNGGGVIPTPELGWVYKGGKTLRPSDLAIQFWQMLMRSVIALIG
jgi:hypothetical protein